MGRLLLVCLGGALGSGARYLVATAMAHRTGAGFPWGTLTVNVVGCFLIELVVHAGSRAVLSPTAVLTFATGVMGGFTTYSAFNAQLIGFARAGGLATAGGYFAATVLGCVAAGVLGVLVSSAIWGR